MAYSLWWATLAGYSCDWNLVYQRINEIYDAMQEPSPREKLDSLLKECLASSPSNRLRHMLTATGRGKVTGNSLAFCCAGNTVQLEHVFHRAECSEHMQRLVLAVLLYQLEYGKMPDENWAAQIEPYLGENPKQYFSCPSNPSPKGETTYALVQYGDDLPASLDTLLLVELNEPVPSGRAVISVDDVLELVQDKDKPSHRNGMNTARRSGAVRFVPLSIGEEDLLRLLGRER
jgi:hypothetical protein